MPQKCSVPNCKGNYLSGPKVSVFSFPTDEGLRMKWLKAINRENFIPTKYSRVCELHFKKNEVARSVSAYDDKKDRWLTAPLSVPRLVKDAVPSVFPECDNSTSISPEDLEKTDDSEYVNAFEAEVKIEIKDEPLWLEELSPSDVELLSEEPVSSHFRENNVKCHFEKNMFWQNKDGRRNLKINAAPSIAAPKIQDTQVQKTTKVMPEKSINREETTFQPTFAQRTSNPRNKRRHSGCCDEHEPGPKRQKTKTTKVMPEKSINRERNQMDNEGIPYPRKQVTRVPKRNQTVNKGASTAQKEAAKAAKRNQTESEGAPSAQKEAGKVPRRSQIKSDVTPPAQKLMARTPKNVREVSSMEKPKVLKASDKEVPRETAVATKSTSKKIWCKLDDICRLCIKKCHRPTNVYDNDLAFKIEAISSIRGMRPTDGLPVNVCQDCKDMTNIFYTFKLQCEAADETLRTCLKALQGEDSNTVVKQQTVAKPLFPELFKFSAFSSDESDIEEVDSEVAEEEEALQAESAMHKVPVPAVQAKPAVKVAPEVHKLPVQAVPAVSVVQAVPAVMAVPVVQAVPAVKAVPTVKVAPKARTPPSLKAAPVVQAVKAVPAVCKTPVVDKVPVVKTATPSTSTVKSRARSPPSRSLQDELNKAWTEFTDEEDNLLVTKKNTATGRKENKLEHVEPRNVAKRKPFTKSFTSPKPSIIISSSQKERGQKKDEPQKDSTPHQVYKSQLIERQNTPLQDKVDLIKHLGNNVEVTRQKQRKGTPGNIMVAMVNNPKRTYNVKIDQQKTENVNLENVANKQNGSGENISSKGTVLGGGRMKNHGPAVSALKVGALGQNVDIYRIPSQKPKAAVVENKSPATKDLTLQRTQIQESNGHLVQPSKSENSSDEVLKVKNNSDRKLCLTALEEADASLQAPLENKVEQNLQPLVKTKTNFVPKGDSTENLQEQGLEHTKDGDQRLEPVTDDLNIHEQDCESSSSEQNLYVTDADDVASEKLKENLQPELPSGIKVAHEEKDINTASTERLEEGHIPEVFTAAITGEAEQTSEPALAGDAKVHAEKGNTSPSSEKPVETFSSISLPSPAVITKNITLVNLKVKGHADVTENKSEVEAKELQKQEGPVDLAEAVAAEKVNDITQNIVEELLNGATMFTDTDSVEPEVPMSLGEPERKTNEAKPLVDILESRDEADLPQDISKLLEQPEEAADADTTSEKRRKSEELEAEEESSELQENSEERSGIADCDRSADHKKELDRIEEERQCHICAKSFPVSQLQHHIASHWSQKDLLCEKCGISFFFPADLQRHVMNHGPQGLATNKEDSSTIKQELQPRVSRQRTFTCGACGMDFTNWFQLRDHKLIHKKGKRHMCGSCSKHFRTKYLLQDHMWIHTVLKKPNCELCGKTFSLPWYVDRHIAEDHS